MELWRISNLFHSGLDREHTVNRVLDEEFRHNLPCSFSRGVSVMGAVDLPEKHVDALP